MYFVLFSFAAQNSPQCETKKLNKKTSTFYTWRINILFVLFLACGGCLHWLFCILLTSICWEFNLWDYYRHVTHKIWYSFVLIYFAMFCFSLLFAGFNWKIVVQLFRAQANLCVGPAEKRKVTRIAYRRYVQNSGKLNTKIYTNLFILTFFCFLSFCSLYCLFSFENMD